MKHIFTRKQAVSIIHQVRNGVESPDLMAEVDLKHPLFKITNESLMDILCEFIDEENIAGVVD
jgi:hypothetical protein